MPLKQVAGAITIFAAGLLPATAIARDPANVLMPENTEARALQGAVGDGTAGIAGDTIYLSGGVAGPAKGESDLAPGYERAFAHIAATLARAGAIRDGVDLSPLGVGFRFESGAGHRAVEAGRDLPEDLDALCFKGLEMTEWTPGGVVGHLG